VQGNEHTIKEIEVYDEYAEHPPEVEPEADGMLMEEME
jgi:hypothetical protein